MKIFELFQKAKPIADSNFVNRLNEDMSICEFSEEVKSGFLFFLGWLIPSIDESVEPSEIERMIGLYSIPSGDISEFGQINDFFIGRAIYTGQHILHRFIYKQEDQLDNHLRKIAGASSEIILLKSGLDDSLINKFHGIGFSLNELTKFYGHLFSYIGNHLSENKLSYSDCYEAGFAFYNMQVQMDSMGTQYMANVFLETLPPLYKAFTKYPILYTQHRKEFDANHIFSSILFFFYKGIPDKILLPIHVFHQNIFYEPGTIHLRALWSPFTEESLLSVFVNAITIRKTNLIVDRAVYLKGDQVHKKDLINKPVDFDNLFRAIQEVLWEKYKLSFKEKFLNKGELMQMLGIVFYETCLHSIVLSEDVDISRFQ